MSAEPRTKEGYGDRATGAARRVLVDLGQVLGAYFRDAIVVVGGLVPDLLVPAPDEPHVRSIDVDLALHPERLREGRYAEMVRALLGTGRYERTDREFKLRTVVDLKDDQVPISVDIDFLKPPGRWPRTVSKSVPDFRPLDADACMAAFWNPEVVEVSGLDSTGTDNKVRVRVTSLEGFLVLKAHALDQRDKPKDPYDICYCLDNAPGWAAELAKHWRERRDSPLVTESLRILREKFESVNSFGPRRVAEFYNAGSDEEGERDARKAFELMQKFLRAVDGA